MTEAPSPTFDADQIPTDGLTLMETPKGAWRVVHLDALVPADWNYKGTDDVMSERLRANLERNGQVENLQVRHLTEGEHAGKLEVVNGNHRLPEMDALGQRVAVVFDYGPITRAEAVRLAIETNETRFESDQMELSRRLAEVVEAFGRQEAGKTLPYTDEGLDHHLDLLNFDWREPELDTGKGEAPPSLTLHYEGEQYERMKAALKAAEGNGVLDEDVPNSRAVLALVEYAVQRAGKRKRPIAKVAGDE